MHPFALLQYQHWKSQSRTKIMTTAAPVAGISFTQAIVKQESKQGAEKIRLST